MGSTCPSARAEPGALLLGVAGPDGRIKHLGTPLKVDAAFLDRAAAQGDPEARMRFAAPCQEGVCGHWTGEKCGLIERVFAEIDQAAADPRTGTLPRCVLRAKCRWYDQEGRAACLACDLVVRTPDGAEEVTDPA